MKISSLVGGFAGACALTLINQIVSKIDKDAPRLDLLGMNAVAKLIRSPQSAPILVRNLLPMSVAGDLVSNSLYYGMAGGNSSNQRLLKGALLGLGAGIGAVALPKKMGLNETHTNRTTKTQVLTIAWYTLGGLVAAATMNAIEKDTESLPSKIKDQIKAHRTQDQRVLAGL
jgi:hypothetical protein